MNLTIREYNENDLISMMEIWNEVVEDGIAFPQMEPLTLEEAKEFFACQSFSAVAQWGTEIVGLYILHPNAVVKSNLSAHHLYEKLGFVKLGVVPGGFLLKDGNYEDIVLYYHLL